MMWISLLTLLLFRAPQLLRSLRFSLRGFSFQFPVAPGRSPWFAWQGLWLSAMALERISHYSLQQLQPVFRL